MRGRGPQKTPRRRGSRKFQEEVEGYHEVMNVINASISNAVLWSLGGGPAGDAAAEEASANGAGVTAFAFA